MSEPFEARRMIVTNIIFANTRKMPVLLCDADGHAIPMTPAEWQAFLHERGAVSLPFEITSKEFEG
ncbi:MAG: hypothetical protein H8E39_00135 [Alphaproteobacteria bacterium]|nr:hypothetical protein [Alphaproteobacteria bacterium]